MTYPNFKNKHLAESLFHPEDYAKYKKWNKSGFPRRYIIVYQSTPLRYIMRKYIGKYEKLPFNTNLPIIKLNKIGVIKIKGIGSPNAVTFLEELIVLGGKEFINIGTAGGLQKEGVFLCDKAIRDEGTSYHYIKPGKYSYPDKNLTKKFERVIKQQGIDFTVAPTWTIDAPYRETKEEIIHYKNEGVATVEMEASALFAVASVRKVKIASAFVVSDVLGDKWDPRFHKMDVKKSLNRLADAAISCLSKS